MFLIKLKFDTPVRSAINRARKDCSILRVKSTRDIWTANGVFPFVFSCYCSSVSSGISRHRLLPLRSVWRKKDKERQRAGFTGLEKRDVIIPATPWSTAAKLLHHECYTNGSCRNRNDNACDEKKGPLRHLLFVILSGHRNIVSNLVHCESSAVNGCRQNESPKSW